MAMKKIKLNSKLIKAEMVRQSMTYREFAKRLGMTESAIVLFLQKETTTIKTINKIAMVLNANPKDLLI